MTQTEALKLALEAIHDLEGEINGYRTVDFPIPEKAKAAIKEALANHIEDNLAMVAQPEQEPIGHRDGYWCDDLTCKKCYSADFRFKHKNSVDKKCLTTSPQRKPLTDEERFQLRCQWSPEIHGALHDYLIQQTEAAHGIKE